ncbi:hypothetical protein Y032_0106g3765 [Ancylostoma ceylanicum]|uniref:Uncharacterized protein n=1 Tax=Ancylostoma ceylanicum TaxID=53326 RepID=A0A016TFW2_9BILA|nr:hypothetical protein Y032_0106g3765 [Ancylostoma ceylanicum]
MNHHQFSRCVRHETCRIVGKEGRSHTTLIGAFGPPVTSIFELERRHAASKRQYLLDHPTIPLHLSEYGQLDGEPRQGLWHSRN